MCSAIVGVGDGTTDISCTPDKQVVRGRAGSCDPFDSNVTIMERVVVSIESPVSERVNPIPVACRPDPICKQAIRHCHYGIGVVDVYSTVAGRNAGDCSGYVATVDSYVGCPDQIDKERGRSVCGCDCFYL